MADIPLLQPLVLQGVVEKFLAPPDLLAARMVTRQSYPFPTWAYDVVKGGRNLAVPNTPNAEANIVKQLTVGQVSGSFIYVREKKVFSPTTLHWLRQPGTLNNINQATRRVADELRDLNLRTERFVEWCIWQMFSGVLTINKNNVVAVVDYLVASSHKPTAGTLWSTLTYTGLEADIRAWKRLITRDALATPTRVIANDLTMAYITQNTILRNINFLSDRMKEQIATTGDFGPLWGLSFTTYDLGYVDDVGVEQRFLPDGKLLMLAEGNDPFAVYEGPSADDDAPEGTTGKFSKSWKEQDPSARQILIEYTFMPVMPRPEQIVYATVG
jgi:hypothetical protein